MERRRVFLLDHPDDPGAEVCVGACLTSPDIGFSIRHVGNVAQLLANPAAALPTISPVFGGSIFVRVRSDGTMQSSEPLRLRVFGRAASDTRAFPAADQLVADITTQWVGSSACAGRCNGEVSDGASEGLTWERVAGNETIQVFRIPWVSVPHAPAIVRAVVSAPGDASPHFFTSVEKSNNLAQAMLATKPFNHLIELPSIRRPDLPSNWPLALVIDVDFKHQRPAHLFIPSHSGWADDGTLDVLPTAADGDLIPLAPGTNILPLSPSSDPWMHVLIDSRAAGPPDPADRIRLKLVAADPLFCGELTAAESQVLPDSVWEWHLGSEGYRESFEWPSGWTLSGSWEVRDLAAGSCHAAASGRRALGFGAALDGCPAKGTGAAWSAPVRVPEGHATYLAFRELVQAASDAEREVALEVDGQMVVLAGEFGPDPACAAVWCDRTIDLSAYSGKEVRFRFALDSPGGESGWYLDDLELLP